MRRHMAMAALLALALLAGLEAQARVGKQVVVLAGLPGSGKTTLAESLSRSLNAPRLTCGDVIRKWIKAQGLPYTPETDRAASQHFARTPGEIARQLGATIERDPSRTVILDGVRSPADVRVLREQGFDVRVVALRAPAKLRYKRMQERGRFGGETVDYLRARDRREIGLGVLHLLRRPFARIDMTGSITDVPSQAKQLADRLQRSWAAR